MNLRPSYLIRLGDATSQWLNVAILNGDANESISGRAYREGWKTAERIINALVWWESDHCRMAYMTDILRAQEIVEESA